MNNKPKPSINDVVASEPEELPTLSTNIGQGESLEGPVKSGELGPRLPIKRIFGVSLLTIGVLAGVLLTLHTVAQNKQQSANNANPMDKSLQLKSQTIPLSDLGLQPISLLPQTNQITVNGNVNVADSVILDPTPTPTSAVAGQLYYDQSRNQLAYYNGTGFVYLLQPSSGTSVTNNTVTNNITNLGSVTNVTNNYGSSGITAINGNAGSIAMFDGSGSLTESMLSQTGNTLSTGNGVQSVTIGSTNGASAAVLQGGTGNVAVNTGAVSGTSGTITIESGASSTTSAGNVTVDTGFSIVNGIVVGDKDFETGFDNIVDGFGYHDTLALSNAEAHGGSQSLAVTVGMDPVSSPGWKIIDTEPFVIPVTAQHVYRFSAWVRAGTTSSAVFAYANFSDNGFETIAQDEWNSGTDTSSGWTEIAGTLVAPATATRVSLELDGSGTTIGEVHYVDDMTVTDISASTATAALNLGATNAQAVNIGNTNQTDATAIAGGGVTINGGIRNVNITGGGVAISAPGPSSFTTTGGALTLTSATSATWGVGGTNFGNGGDLTINAGTANNGSSNGGTLTLEGGATSGTGVSGAVAVATQASNGVSGAITIQSGDSATTSSGNVSIDTGANVISGVTTDSATFEDNTTDNYSPWFCDTIAPTNTQAHGGTYSLMITESAGCGNWGVILNGNNQTYSATPGHHIVVSLWMKAATVSEQMFGQISWNGGNPATTMTPTSDTTTGWTQMTTSVTVPAGSTSFIVDFGMNGTPGEVHYVDDIQVIDLSASSASSVLNLGATNAQVVNIGNLNELGATTITGGDGIDLNAGVANVNVNGGSIEVNGSANSTVGTNNGSLTLTSGGGANGGVVVSPQAVSTTAFQVQTANGPSLFTVDTTDNALVVGNDGTPTATTIRGGAASGTNAAGANLTIAGSNGTGYANGGDIIFETAQAAVGGIGFDNVQHASSLHGSPITMSYTTTTQSDRVMIAYVNNTDTTSITYDGIPLTFLGSITSGTHQAGGVSTELWYLVNPPSGTYALNAADSINDGGELSVETFYNVNQANPFGPLASTENVTSGVQSTSMTIATTNTSQVAVDAFSVDNNYVACTTTNANQTILQSINDQYIDDMCNSDQVGANGGVNFTYQANNADWADIGVPLNPAAPGSTPLITPTGTTADTLNDRLHITAAGYVGIDNANPQYSLDVAGSARFQNTADSTSAFQVQDSNGAVIFAIDTTNKIVTVTNLVATGTLTVDGHIISGGATPTYAAGAAACTTPTLSINGTDTAGTITLTTGSSGCSVSGALATVTFANAFAAAPHVTLTPGSPSALTLGAYVDDATVSTTGFTIGTNTIPPTGTQYQWNYQVIQ